MSEASEARSPVEVLRELGDTCEALIRALDRSSFADGTDEQQRAVSAAKHAARVTLLFCRDLERRFRAVDELAPREAPTCEAPADSVEHIGGSTVSGGTEDG